MKASDDDINVGDVHLLPLGQSEGITPKNGQTARNKYFIVLGLDVDGNMIGGVVINSSINLKLPTSITDFLMPVTEKQLPFLSYSSFINCSRLKVVKRDKFNKSTLKGTVKEKSLLDMILGTVTESPYTSKQQLREFGIIK